SWAGVAADLVGWVRRPAFGSRRPVGMNEGQGAPAASVPWGADDGPPPPARPLARPGPPQAQVTSAPLPAQPAGEDDEPHARVDARKLEAALLELRDAAGKTQLLLDFPGIEAARAERQRMISQIEDYLLPRLRESGAPILIAMVGSTGAGKSTLLN